MLINVSASVLVLRLIARFKTHWPSGTPHFFGLCMMAIIFKQFVPRLTWLSDENVYLNTRPDIDLNAQTKVKKRETKRIVSVESGMHKLQRLEDAPHTPYKPFSNTSVAKCR